MVGVRSPASDDLGGAQPSQVSNQATVKGEVSRHPKGNGGLGGVAILHRRLHLQHLSDPTLEDNPP